MYQYKVWDAEGSSVEYATEYEASTPSEAAEKYGEDDIDGQGDGVYVNEGLEVCVMGSDGIVLRFHVTAEYEPTFYAAPVTSEATPTNDPAE
jgi:hypothetical protein